MSTSTTVEPHARPLIHVPRPNSSREGFSDTIAASDSRPSSSAIIHPISSYSSPPKQRPGSIYTLSRLSLSSQLSLLTSLQIPDADSIASKISSLSAANIAARALLNSGSQINHWISNATEIIGSLDSNDDVE